MRKISYTPLGFDLHDSDVQDLDFSDEGISELEDMFSWQIEDGDETTATWFVFTWSDFGIMITNNILDVTLMLRNNTFLYGHACIYEYPNKKEAIEYLNMFMDNQ